MAFDLRILFASDLEGGSTASADPVVNFAAIVEALDLSLIHISEPTRPY